MIGKGYRIPAQTVARCRHFLFMNRMGKGKKRLVLFVNILVANRIRRMEFLYRHTRNGMLQRFHSSFFWKLQNIVQEKNSQNRTRLLFHGLIRLWLRNSKSRWRTTRFPLPHCARSLCSRCSVSSDWDPSGLPLNAQQNDAIIPEVLLMSLPHCMNFCQAFLLLNKYML